MALDVQGVYLDTIVNGGVTVNLDGSAIPSNGFVVALGRKYGHIVPATDYRAFSKALESMQGVSVGTWFNDGVIYLDSVEVIRDSETAYRLGVLRNQISVWDIANATEIETHGNGQ